LFKEISLVKMVCAGMRILTREIRHRKKQQKKSWQRQKPKTKKKQVGQKCRTSGGDRKKRNNWSKTTVLYFLGNRHPKAGTEGVR